MRGDRVHALAFTPDSHGLICGNSDKECYSTFWDISPLMGEPGGHPDSPGVSKRDTLSGSDTCTVKFTGCEVHINIERVNVGCV